MTTWQKVILYGLLIVVGIPCALYALLFILAFLTAFVVGIVAIS
jgi:hypothetical protein